MKKLTFTVLAALLMQIGFAFPVIVEGFLSDKEKERVANVEIHIKVHPNLLNFEYKNVKITDDQGYFSDTIDVPDVIHLGWLVVSFMDCDSNRVDKRVIFNRNKRHHHLRLRYCQNQSSDALCFVKIVPFRNDTGVVLKTVSLNNHDYKFLWNTGETATEIMVSEDGNYCVEIEDSAGCQARDCISIRIPKDCETRISLDQANVSSSLAGYTLVAHTKGNAPYTFDWSTGDSTQRIFVQDTGTYCVDVEDAKGCKSSDCIVVKPRCQTKIKLIRTDFNAEGSPTLSAQALGHPPFTYLWSTGDSTQTIEGNYDMEYCVTVTDALGCTSRDCAFYASDRFCKAEIKIAPNSLTSNSAGIQLVARTKGHPPFQYIWSTGDTSKFTTINDSITKYCLTVTDGTGCVSEACVDLENLMDRCKVHIIRRNRSQIMAVPFGIPPFKYIWSNGSEKNQTTIDSAGTYCVEMIDGIGCLSHACIEIGQTDLPALCDVRIKASRLSDGNTKLSVHTPGNVDYATAWDNGATTSSIIIDSGGTYCVTIMNAFCQAEACISLDPDPNQNINQGIGKVINKGNVNRSNGRIQFGPNPVKNELFLRINAPESADISLKVFSLDGRMIKKMRLPRNAGIIEKQLNFSQLQAGIYVVQLSGSQWNESFRIIKQP